METRIDSVLDMVSADHPSLDFGRGSGAFLRLSGTPIIEAKCYRGHKRADESFEEDEQCEEEDDDDEEEELDHPDAVKDGRIINALENDLGLSMKEAGREPEPETKRHDVSHSGSEASAGLGSSGDSVMDLDGETDKEGNRRKGGAKKVPVLTVAQYESAQTFASVRRELIMRLHVRGFLSDPRLYLSHKDKKELERGRRKGKGVEMERNRVGVPPFVPEVRGPGATLKAPLMERSKGRTNFFRRSKRSTKSVPMTVDSPMDDASKGHGRPDSSRRVPPEPEAELNRYETGPGREGSLLFRLGTALKEIILFPFRRGTRARARNRVTPESSI